MDLKKIIQKGEISPEIVRTAILHEHNLKNCLKKSDLKNWKKIDFKISEEAAKRVRAWAKKLKVSEESILYAVTINYAREVLNVKNVDY